MFNSHCNCCVFQIHLSFLYVGHTHEDIDAAFSRIAEQLRRTEAETLPELLKILGPSGRTMRGLYDLREWMSPHLVTISHHSKPHHFKFEQCENGNCKNFYKGNNDDPWKELESLFKETGGSVRLPAGKPKLTEPNFEHLNTARLEKSIESWSILFSDHRDGNKYRWWKKFLKEVKDLILKKSERLRYARINSEWILPLLPKLRESGSSRNEELQLPPPLQALLDEESQEPQVSITLLLKGIIFASSLCNTSLQRREQHMETLALNESVDIKQIVKSPDVVFIRTLQCNQFQCMASQMNVGISSMIG